MAIQNIVERAADMVSEKLIKYCFKIYLLTASDHSGGKNQKKGANRKRRRLKTGNKKTPFYKEPQERIFMAASFPTVTWASSKGLVSGKRSFATPSTLSIVVARNYFVNRFLNVNIINHVVIVLSI